MEEKLPATRTSIPLEPRLQHPPLLRQPVTRSLLQRHAGARLQSELLPVRVRAT
jgi:hypothetical protein